jgi:hypothetical protein
VNGVVSWASIFLKMVNISESSWILSPRNLEKRLNKFIKNAQHDCHTSIMMWLPIVVGFIVIRGGGDEND